MFLSQKSRNELKWWITSLPNSYKRIDHGKPNVTISTDACTIGWGAISGNSKTQGLWSKPEINCHINILELRAVELALLSLLRHTTNQHIRILSDNVTTVTFINAFGGCKSKECNHIARRIWLWTISKHNWLSATHQAGHLNTIADKLCRHFEDSIEWKIDTRLFRRIDNNNNISFKRKPISQLKWFSIRSSV